MKNSYYAPNLESLLTYLVERNATYTPIMASTNNEVIRTKIKESQIKFKSKIEKLEVSNPIDYRINIIPKKDGISVINVTLNKRIYTIYLEYVDSGVTLPFSFSFEQISFRKEVVLNDYVEDYESLNVLMDNAIKSQILKDVTNIFSGEFPSIPNLNTGASWNLKSEEIPSISVKVGCLFD